MLEVLLGVLAALVAAVAFLWRALSHAKAAARRGDEYTQTRMRMDESQEFDSDDLGAVRDFLRTRGKSGGDL